MISKFLFKYEKDDSLSLYIERTHKGRIEAFIQLTDVRSLKYMRNENAVWFRKYSTRPYLLQKNMGYENWLTISDRTEGEMCEPKVLSEMFIELSGYIARLQFTQDVMDAYMRKMRKLISANPNNAAPSKRR